jgi:beta-lactamase regulating signal transducer with metallopeptidase domain
MSFIQSLLAQPALARIGWVLLHLIWQGAAVAALLWIVLLALGGASASWRYIACCVAMAVIAALPVCTYVALADHGTASSDPIRQAQTAQLTIVPQFISQTFAPRGQAPTAHTLAVPQIAVFVWMAGVILLATWRIGGWTLLWMTVHRSKVVEQELLACAKAIAQRLNLRCNFRVLDCARITGPAVVGWLKPVVLLPVTALSGLSPAQIEAILAHELAHIRRHDYLINVLQMAIETALFYHPAVWWISAQMREERENCCDDIAAQTCGDRLLYARALARMEELRHWPAPLAMGAAGGPLARRIRRILQTPQRRKIGAQSPAAAILLATVVVILPLWAMKSHAQTTAAQHTAATTQATTNKATEANGSQIQPQDLQPINEDYRIGPSDLLSVTITDLSGPGKDLVRQTRVTDSGYISLPYIGKIKAEGETEIDLEKSIAKAYHEANLVANAPVSVSMIETRGRTFTVLGDVDAQNVYSITSANMRLLDALAMAKLSTRRGVVLVIRPTPGKKDESRVIAIPLDTLLAGDLHYNLVVRPHDVIRVIAPATAAR